MPRLVPEFVDGELRLVGKAGTYAAQEVYLAKVVDRRVEKLTKQRDRAMLKLREVEAQLGALLGGGA